MFVRFGVTLNPFRKEFMRRKIEGSDLDETALEERVVHSKRSIYMLGFRKFYVRISERLLVQCYTLKASEPTL